MRLDLSAISKISLSSQYDGFICLHTPGEEKNDKGDMLFETPNAIEMAMFIRRTCVKRAKTDGVSPMELPVIECVDPVHHIRKGGKAGDIQFKVEEEGWEGNTFGLEKRDGKLTLVISAAKMANVESFKKQVRTSVRMKAPKPTSE